jgi:tRNA/tmRNA/rRNA uracil-C5-methylase (TrmA/RlmC/RlmD family)
METDKSDPIHPSSSAKSAASSTEDRGRLHLPPVTSARLFGCGGADPGPVCVPAVKKKRFNDHPFPYHAELELEIATLTNLGLGLGRVVLGSGQRSAVSDQQSAASPNPRASENRGGDAPGSESAIQNPKSEIQNPSGWVVMVPFALPGERVRVRVFRNHRNYSEADLLEVLTPSPHRVAARCPLFTRCGGCQYQHLAYAEQLAWKRRQVEELLRHMAGVDFPVAPTIPSQREFGYRSKLTPHFAVPRRPREEGAGDRGQGTGVEPDHAAITSEAAAGNPQPQTSTSTGGCEAAAIGFLRQGTRFTLVDVPECPIATPEINAALPAVRDRTRARLAAGEYKRDATLLLRHAEEGVVTDYDAVIHERVGDLRLRFLARDFFQNNPFILPAFTGYVRAQAAATGATRLVDTYCGSGLFALACAPAFARVAGVEVSETSVRFARENAAANGLANATFSAGDAATIFAGLGPEFAPADTVVVIDPPRKGCDASFLAQLFAFGPRGVVYVSCDPATQMRDLRDFLAAGYVLTAVQPFDLFPQTRHLECVVTLRRG